MAIKQKNLYKGASSGYKLVGWASSVANYLLLENKSAAAESDTYYDTTLNQLRTYDGTNWSAAGLSSTSTGGLNNAASIGSTITVDGSTVAADFAVTVSDGANDVAATFTQNDVTNNGADVVLVNTGAGVALDITSAGTYDIQGTSDTWDIGIGGAAHFTAVAVDDDEDIELGTASNGDVRMLFHDGTVGTAGNSLLIDALGSDEQIQIGDATYSFDVWFVGETATTNFMKWDIDAGENSVGALVFDNADIVLGDNDRLIFGDASGGDWTMDWDNTSLTLIPAANNSPILVGSATAGVDLSIYGDTATSILQWYSAGDRLVFKSAASASDIMIQLDDYVQMTFGTGASNFGTTGTGDVGLEFDGTNFNLTAIAADTPWHIGGTSTGFDTTYYYKTAGTITLDWDGPADGNTAGVIIEGGADTFAVQIMDGDYLLFGDSATIGGTTDATLRWDNSAAELEIVGATHFEDDVTIGTATSDEENLTVYGDLTVSGTFTHTGAYNPGSLTLTDNEKINFGTDTDFILDFDSTTGHLWLEAKTANTEFSMGEATNFDFKICGGTATKYFLFDTDDSALHFTCLDTAIRFSDGTDICTIGPMASNVLPIESNTADGHAIKIGATSNIDVGIYGETATSYCYFDCDNSALLLELDGFTLKFQDASSSMTIGPCASNVLPFNGGAANDTISFGTTTKVDLLVEGNAYDMQWDNSRNHLLFNDSAILAFGGAASSTADYTISTAGSTSPLILVAATANDAFQVGNGTTGTDIKWLCSGDTDAYVLFDASADTNKGLVSIGVDDHGVDLTLFGATAGEAVKWDQSADALQHVDGTATFSWTMESNALQITGDTDGRILILGSGNEMDVKWAAGDANTNTFVLFDASDDTGVGLVQFGQDDYGVDVKFHGATANYMVHWDQSANSLVVADSTIVTLGNTAASPDQTIVPDGTNVDWTITSGILTIGDGGTTNFLTIKADGEINLAGTACVTKNHQLPIQTGGGTVTVSAITGAPSIDFNADGEIVYLSFQVPNDWDAASDMYIKSMIQNEIAETDGDDIEIVWTIHGIADGELNSDAGQTAASALNLTGGDQAINIANLTSATIDFNHGTYAIAAADTVILKGVVSLAAGTECTGPLHIIDHWIEYTANKLGTAT